MKIYLDFDGTVVEHVYPEIGKYNKGCFEVVKKLQDAGHEIILNTYRADCDNGTLEESIKYIEENAEFTLDGVEQKKIQPYPWNWEYFFKDDTIFLDDAAYDMPLKEPLDSSFDIVDWSEVDKQLRENSIY